MTIYEEVRPSDSLAAAVKREVELGQMAGGLHSLRIDQPVQRQPITHTP